MGVDESRCRIMERWIDADDFSPKKRDASFWEAQEPIKLLFVGRISEDKNLDLLIRLYNALESKHDSFVIHVIGDGPYFDAMRRKTARLERFHLVGPKFKEDLQTAYASSDLFIHPGLLDTFGNVVIEAQASGLPCVVMNEGGPQELITNGKTGLVASTEEDFIAKVESLIAKPQRIREMGETAAAYAAQRFSEERIFQNFWKDVTDKHEDDGSRPTFQFDHAKQDEKVVKLPA